ncbi:YceI family protein [Bailinhaonella thermotolerans]|uniref:Polyisoprenoid-binding protein n=1 Tax=Bailinhaonella thermotolerans TaxID=1070861 RepID=A0A3A4A1Q3_9ACTN|nr:YceI family protein [Bailinhaonella thermotolerans]RJL22118.1 polyisoprenoid-binding protein [Bailinhaonella thermotolerans]
MTQVSTRDWQGLTLPTPGTFVLDTAHTRVGFVARHMMVSKVRGSFLDFSGSITVAENPLDSTAEATIQTGSIDTGVADRDGHLRSGDFLDTEQYPTMTFRTNKVTDHEGNSFTVLGELTIRGVTREIEMTVEFEGVSKSPWGQEVAGFTINAEIDREEFGLTWNQALETGGVLVGKKIKIEIEGEAIRQA